MSEARKPQTQSEAEVSDIHTMPDDGTHECSADCWCEPELIGDYTTEGGVKHVSLEKYEAIKAEAQQHFDNYQDLGKLHREEMEKLEQRFKNHAREFYEANATLKNQLAEALKDHIQALEAAKEYKAQSERLAVALEVMVPAFEKDIAWLKDKFENDDAFFIEPIIQNLKSYIVSTNKALDEYRKGKA